MQHVTLMRRTDKLFLTYLFYGSRQMLRHLWREGVHVGRHQVQCLLRLMGLQAIYWAHRTTSRDDSPGTALHHQIPATRSDLEATGVGAMTVFSSKAARELGAAVANRQLEEGQREQQATTVMPKTSILSTSTGVPAIILILFLVSSSSWATTQTQGQEKACLFGVNYENDQLFTLDQNYTTGLLFMNTCNFTNGDLDKDEPLWSLPRNLNKAASSWLPLSDPVYVQNSYYFGFLLFTPNDLTLSTPGEGDGRPYASLFYYGDSIAFAHKTAGRTFKQDIQLGLLGMSWGGTIQKEVHRIVNSTIPEGWSTQISDGGEPTFLYALQETTLWHGDNDPNRSIRSDLVTTHGLTLGYYNSLQASVAARFGRIISPFWINYGPIFKVTPRVQKVKDEPVTRDRSRSTNNNANTKNNNANKLTLTEAYIFLLGGVDLVLYNALLQGQFRNNAYEIAASDVERFVPHAVAGIVLQFGRIQLSFSHTYREREMRGGESHRWNNFSVAFFL